MPSDITRPEGAATPPGSRSVLVLITVPETMVGNDLPTLHRKLRENADGMLLFLAEELHRNLGQPDASPELIASRISSELRAREREERRG